MEFRETFSSGKSPMNTNQSRKFWGLEVEAHKSVTVKLDQDLFIHISRATLDKGKNGESAVLYVTIDGKKLVIGSLTQGNNPDISLDLVFEKEFTLSHNCDSGSVHFIGYQSPIIKQYDDHSSEEEEDVEVRATVPAIGNEPDDEPEDDSYEGMDIDTDDPDDDSDNPDDDLDCPDDKEYDLDVEEETPNQFEPSIKKRVNESKKVGKSHLNANQRSKFWGLEVKPLMSLTVKPDQDFLIHISKATLDQRRKGESAILYVTVDGKKLAIGTLPQGNIPLINLDLEFEKDFQLSHNYDSGSVYFLGYKSPKMATESASKTSLSSDTKPAAAEVNKKGTHPTKKVGTSHMNANQSPTFWGFEVKAKEPLTAKPDQDCIINITQASLDKGKKGEFAVLYVTIDGKKLVIGTLPQGNIPHISLDLVFEKEFVLSHNLERGSVHFLGYKPPMKNESVLKRLPTKKDLEKAIELIPKPLTKASYQRENPYGSDSDSEDPFVLPTYLVMTNIDKKFTLEDILLFFQKQNLTVTVPKIYTDSEDNSKLEALICFRSHADLKSARKLHGDLLGGDTAIFFDSSVGTIFQYIVTGFDEEATVDELNLLLEATFSPFGTIRKIFIPEDELGHLMIAYVIMDITSVEKLAGVLKLDKMGKFTIHVGESNLLPSVAKTLI